MPTGDVSKRMRQERLADADRTDERDVGVRLDEAHRHELVEQRLVVRHLRTRVPLLDLHLRVELRASRAHRHRRAVSTRDLVGEQQEEEVLMCHLLLACEREPIGQRIDKTP